MTKKYSVSEFARALNISRRTIYRWIYLQVIPAPRRSLGGKPYYTLEDLDVIAEKISDLDGGKNGL